MKGAKGLIVGAIVCAVAYFVYLRMEAESHTKSVKMVMMTTGWVAEDLELNVRNGYDFAKSVKLYVDSGRNEDLSGCPDDFREAYTHHLNAWEDLESQVANEPKSPGGFALQTLFNLMTGEPDGGTRRNQSAYETRSAEVRHTWAEVQSIASKYGVPNSVFEDGKTFELKMHEGK